MKLEMNLKNVNVKLFNLVNIKLHNHFILI